MGTGKTSVGRQVATHTTRTFIDLDENIELQEKRSIADIFAKEGEPYFRRIEKELLQEVSREDDRVVACGGGIIIDKDNIATMKATGRIICLHARVDVILARTGPHTHRPLLRVENQKEQIEALLARRAHLYALADVTIDTSSLSVTQVAEKIIALNETTTYGTQMT